MRSVCTVATSVLLSTAASAAGAEQRHVIDLPEGNLQQSVLELGRQARISIALADPSLARIRVPRVRGRMTVEEALRRILAGSGARFLAPGGRNYRIVRAEQPPPVVTPGKPTALPFPPDVPAPEIVVTATKRNLGVRDYPGPVVLAAGDLFTTGNAADGTAAIIERIPSLGSTHLGPGRNKLFIRAIADSSFSGQTQSTVGQYFGEARLNFNAPDPALRLYDIASVELLAGPQGTLYGVGSMGGVLRIVPNAPDPRAAFANLTSSVAATAHGELSHELAGTLNLPLAEGRAGLRLVAYNVRDGGYIDDVGRQDENVNRTRIRGGRGALLVELPSGWTLEAGGLAQQIEGKDGQYADRAYPDLSRRTALPQPFSNDYKLGHVTLRRALGAVQLTSTFSVADQDLVENFDISALQGQPALFRQRNRLSLLSAEARLSRTGGEGSGWLAGIYLLHNRSTLDRAKGPSGALQPLLGARNSVDEQTLFGELTQRLSDRISLTGGLRVTHVGFEGLAGGSDRPPVGDGLSAAGAKWRVLPSFAANIDPGNGLTAYLRYQESFRPGGLIVRSDATEEITSDHIAAWEAGLRLGEPLRGRVSGAISVSYARWTDIQADTLDTVGLPTTINIGDGKIWTVDGRISWRVNSNLTVDVAAIRNYSLVTNSDPGVIIVGEAPLPNVPKSAGRFGVDFQKALRPHLELKLSGWGRYVGKSRLGIGPMLGRSQGNYLDVGFEARLGSRGLFVFTRGTNLLDQVGNRFSLGSIFNIDAEDQVTPLRPRTIRIGMGASF